MIRINFFQLASKRSVLWLKTVFFAFNFVLTAPSEVMAAQIIKANIVDFDTKFRLIINLTESVKHDVFVLESPSRLVIDLSDTALVYNLNRLSLSNTPIKKIRWARRNSNDLRVVLDLNGPVKSNSFVLNQKNTSQYQLIIDLRGPSNNSEHIKRSDKLSASPASNQVLNNFKPKIIRDGSDEIEKVLNSISKYKYEGRDIVIAIDAGHGGRDPGAVGYNGAKEKNVTLAIAREVASLFSRETGFDAKLIRKGDYYVPLRGRIKKAREVDADLFVSIHADAFHRKSAHGASIYTLSQRGATSEAARWLANRENNSDLIGGGDGISLGDKDNLLASVLLDLSMTDTQARSFEASKLVLKKLGQVNKLHKKDVERAAFVVLKSPDIPSMLVETGFISNPGEAKKLTRTAHQKKVAAAIFWGVKEFFHNKPPLGTLIAMQKEKRPDAHKVVAGETLSDIAERYNVPLKRLLAMNNLSRADHIRIGQRLKLP